ncbi:unnamed protein product [Peronospora destructor]|uniref:Uncharacterized protein n=1 Tax=Peronospora destructor TaxID=86335 RepID=A0AAV0UUT8_9STRA|nr:unnamed protein product [Peronospora destructor]
MQRFCWREHSEKLNWHLQHIKCCSRKYAVVTSRWRSSIGLQRFATLLQSPGASPSVVVSIATLLTEFSIGETSKANGTSIKGRGQYCGESIEVETPAKQKIRRTIGNDKENSENSVVSLASEATMQKMVQRVEQALQQHEEKLRLLAVDEAQKIKKLRHQEVQRHLDEVYLQKQKAVRELADLKKQIITLKRKMMEASTNTDVPITLPYKSDDVLAAVETEINDLQQKP